jgi:hypothetical protein
MRGVAVGGPTVVLSTVLVPWLLAQPAYAASGTGDGGSRLTAIFGLIGAVVLAGGLGVSAYRVSVARRQARARGHDVDRATLRALSGEDDDREDPETR